MANTDATDGLLATYYVSLGDWIGLTTGNPGNTSTPANEAVGGSPAYARQETAWTVTGGTAIGSPITFNVGPGTYTYMIFCSGSSGNNMISSWPISPQVTSVQTTITITPLTSAS